MTNRPARPRTSAPQPDTTPKQALLAPSEEPREIASYRIAASVKQEFRQYVKQLNRDRLPDDEIDVGTIAEAALREYMARHGEG